MADKKTTEEASRKLTDSLTTSGSSATNDSFAGISSGVFAGEGPGQAAAQSDSEDLQPTEEEMRQEAQRVEGMEKELVSLMAHKTHTQGRLKKAKSPSIGVELPTDPDKIDPKNPLHVAALRASHLQQELNEVNRAEAELMSKITTTPDDKNQAPSAPDDDVPSLGDRPDPGTPSPAVSRPSSPTAEKNPPIQERE